MVVFIIFSTVTGDTVEIADYEKDAINYVNTHANVDYRAYTM